MKSDDILSALETVYDHELAESLLDSYEGALKEFRKGNWQHFGNEAGQFIEIARRMIECQIYSKNVPLSEKLPIFNEKMLVLYESYNNSISEVYRIIIPRCLYFMYCLRNKRGMIHKNHISPNKMDATVLLGNMKWVLAEFFRITSEKTFEETDEIVNAIINREVSFIWDTGSALRILNTKMNTKDKILCLLYIKDCQLDTELQNAIEYKNKSEFKKILKMLHKDKLIEYSNDKCLLSPLGSARAEELFVE